MTLKEYREKLGFNLSQMATHWDMSISTLHSWEGGRRMPRPAAMIAIEQRTDGKVKPKDFY